MGDIRGIIIHAKDVSFVAGTALDTVAVGLILKLGEDEDLRFALSQTDAQQLARKLEDVDKQLGNAREAMQR